MALSTTYKFDTDQELAASIALYTDGIQAVHETGQSYNANGVSFNRANLAQMEEALGYMKKERAIRAGAPGSETTAKPVIRRRY